MNDKKIVFQKALELGDNAAIDWVREAHIARDAEEGCLSGTREEYRAWWDATMRSGWEAFLENARCVDRALRRMLTPENVGRIITWRGGCPSGDTFEGDMVWDGEAATAEKIWAYALERAWPDAWEACPVFVDEYRHEIAVAEMRTMRV